MSQAERKDVNSVDEVFGEDHRILGGLLEQIRDSILAGSPKALESLDAFSRGLGRHMSWEEETLFPAVSKRATAAQKRSIESLEIDHERLRDTVNSLHSSLAAADF